MQRREYRGHVIELREPELAAVTEQVRLERDVEPELLIDGEKVRWGRLPDGRFFLEEYAYDWRADLVELAERFIDYNERAEARARGSDTGR